MRGENMDLGKYIDHTVLKPDANEEDVIKMCEEAIQYAFASVCINPSYVKLVSEKLGGTHVKTCTVIGFPLGATPKEVKVFETRTAIANGAEEIDMVINIGALKSGSYHIIEEEIKAVVHEAKGKAHVKVIIETCLLTDEEKEKACVLSVNAGADFVKTSTGFSSGGATLDDVKLMKQVVAGQAKVKASGGVRDYKTALAMIEAGADRIGTSSGIKIVTEQN